MPQAVSGEHGGRLHALSSHPLQHALARLVRTTDRHRVGRAVRLRGLPRGKGSDARMTERLYYHDATITTFNARLSELADAGRKVYLDRTAFYPTSGGQPHDIGTLGGIGVIDVIDEGDRIAHVLDVPMELAPAMELR